jgi:hypothetical protein
MWDTSKIDIMYAMDITQLRLSRPKVKTGRHHSMMDNISTIRSLGIRLGPQ